MGFGEEGKELVLYDSDTYVKDLKEVVEKTPVIREFAGKTVLITGAGGLICSGIVDLLLMSNAIYHTQITIYAADINVDGVVARFSAFPDKVAAEYLHIVNYDATKENKFDFVVDYIIHGASNAHPKAIAERPVETMLDNFSGMYELLEYAKRVQAKNTLFISSSEVYGLKNNNEPFKEDEYGFLDILNPRNSYSSGKRAGETLCASYSSEYGIHTNIVRPGHIYGPTASPRDTRVGSSFAYDAANGRDIVLKSEGKQIRSYCYVLDCDAAMLTVLLKGELAKAYNISDSNSVITIRELARLYAEAGKVRVIMDLPTDKERKAFNPMENSSLSSERLEQLGWKGVFDVAEGTKHTVIVLKDVLNT